MTDNFSERWGKVQRIWSLIDQLRGEEGCPWDRKQTPASAQTYLVEEAHEAAAAIRNGTVQEAAEELGDLLFMILFVLHLYEEQQDFRLEDVCEHISEKMIRRHPHVFGNVEVSTAQQVRTNWERIKAAENKTKTQAGSGVPESLPALMRAYRMLSRLAHKEGEHLNDSEYQAGRFVTMSQQLHTALIGQESLPAELIADLLLTLVNIARLQGYRAEDLLHETLGRM